MKSPKPNAKRRSPPRQSDIVIRPDGTVAVSFLWNEDAPAPSQESSVSQPLCIPEDEYRSCRLCPKRCGFNRLNHRHPRCGDSRLRIATAGLTLGDEPMIRGSRGSGAIMLSGCPLRCPSCHNPEMVADAPEYSPEEFMELAWSLARQGAHNLQILSPTVHWPVLREIFRSLRQTHFPVPIAVKTSGYETIDLLKSLDGLVDIYIPDLKYGPDSEWAARAGAPDYFITATAAILEMHRQTGAAQFNPDGTLSRGVLIRHVKAPLPEAESRHLMDWLDRLPAGIEKSVTDNFTRVERPPGSETLSSCE